MTSSELTDLPPPSIIETVDFDTIKTALIADFAAECPEFTAALESEPVVKLLTIAAYREMLLRLRINQAARANLLAFAAGSNLDHLAAFYGVSRNTGETDAAFRYRVRDHIVGFSVGGSVASYRYVAMSVHSDIEDVSISRPVEGRVAIAVLARATATTAIGDLVAAVLAAVTAKDTRIINDTITVAPASSVRVSVAARIWLRSDASDARLAELETVLRAVWAAERGLGRDVTRSWIIAQLQRAGVYRVELEAPVADIVVAPDTYAEIDDVLLTFEGRGS